MKKVLLGIIVGLLIVSLSACKTGLPIFGEPTITVEGVVKDVFGQVVKGMDVKVTGKETATTITDSNGKFTIKDVTVPYELVVVNKKDKIATVYQGLKRPDPIITIFGDPTGLNKGNVEGALSGGAGFPEPSGTVSGVVFGAPNIVSLFLSNSISSDKTTGKYLIKDLRWSGGTTVNLTAHALQFKSTAGLPTDYTGYGKKASILLQDSKTLSGQDIVMKDVAESRFSGNVFIPSAYQIANNALFANFGKGAQAALLTDILKTKNLSFDYVTPAIKEATITSLFSAKKTRYTTTVINTGLATNTSGLTVSIPSAAEHISPANKATAVDYGTSFSWTEFKNGIHVIRFNAGPGKPQYNVYTKDSSTSIPDLSDMGLTLPKHTRYSWTIEGLSPFANMDEAAAVNPYKVELFAVSGAYSRSSSIEFVTAP